MKQNEYTLPAAAAALAAFVIWLKYRFKILLFYYHYRLIIAFFISCAILYILTKLLDRIKVSRAPKDLEKATLGASPDEDSVLMGYTDKGRPLYFKESFRRKHIDAIGTTDSGKTESIVVPLSAHDMKMGRGLIIIDGKSDRSLLDKLYAYASLYNRENDVKILSLCSPEISHTFNPLSGGTPLEITERVFKAFNFENEYYKNLQYESLLQTLLIFEAAKVKPTPLKVVEALRSPMKLKQLAMLGNREAQIDWVTEQLSLSRDEREKRTSGLVTQFQVMTVGEIASIFNAETSDINMEEAFSRRHIIYCQLPVMKVPTLGKTVGKLVLQCIQSAVATRHLSGVKSREFFGVFLDDFTEYLTEGFVSLLNKSRSANVGILFAHQAVGDLATLGDAVKNTIMTNANLKVFMRTNEPESAEYFSATIGTLTTAKVTERQKSGPLGSTKTGEGSVRDVEEFKFHPNVFKQELGVGEGVVILPHSRGSLPFRVNFRMLPDIEARALPEIKKLSPKSLPALPKDDKAVPKSSDAQAAPSPSHEVADSDGASSMAANIAAAAMTGGKEVA